MSSHTFCLGNSAVERCMGESSLGILYRFPSCFGIAAYGLSLFQDFVEKNGKPLFVCAYMHVISPLSDIDCSDPILKTS